eukprot:149727-Chlamydomonas_euryale.AAC.4
MRRVWHALELALQKTGVAERRAGLRGEEEQGRWRRGQNRVGERRKKGRRSRCRREIWIRGVEHQGQRGVGRGKG